MEYARQFRPISKQTLGALLWGKEGVTSRINLRNLASGKSISVKIDHVITLCKELNVSADFLFGLTEFPNRELEKEAIKQELAELNEKTNELSAMAQEMLNHIN